MKVKELIEILKKYDPEMEVLRHENEYNEYYEYEEGFIEAKEMHGLIPAVFDTCIKNSTEQKLIIG